MVSLISHVSKLWFFIGCAIFVAFCQETEVEITDFFAKVYLAPNEKSKFVGLAQRGERYPVIDQHDTWIRIRFKNVIGWVYTSQVGPIGSSASSTLTSPQGNTSVDSSKSSSQASQTSNQTAAISNTPDSQQSTSGSTEASNERTYQNRSYSSRSSQSNSERTARAEEKPRNWFTKKKLPELPSANQPFDEDTATFYFQVENGPARVMAYLDPKAPILGLAMSGESLLLVGEGDSWCKVQYKNSVGWIERRYGKIIEAGNQGFSLADINPFVYIFAAALILIIVGLIIFLRIRRKKNEIVSTNTVKKNVLMIAKAGKTIQYTLTDANTSLERCFIEIGFSVSIAKDNQTIRTELSKGSPDVVLVDWQFDRNILTSLERLFATLPGSERILFIIYNVPDPSIMQPSRVLPNMSYLGTLFSDRDIFKIVTPLIINENTRTMQKSVQSSALEGEIGDGNLLEVLQFIEIGRKSGCLLVETDRPFGLIYFTEGRIVYAATAQNVLGRDAVFAVLDLSAGKFRFVTNKRPKVTNINLSTLEILMEWTKAVDEAHGN